MPDLPQIAALVGSGFAAGVMNALAGGGTILTFPALLLIGLDARVANATSTVALVPGAVASMLVHRREVAEHREWLRTLLVPSVVGGTLGSLLLLVTPERAFASLAPWLVLFATVLFAVQAVQARRGGAAVSDPGSARRRVIAAAAQFAVAVYGGYFGAGIGILMLAVLGFLGLRDMHAMNGLKNLFGAAINAIACAAFIAAGIVAWPEALTMMTGAVLGGFAGAKLTRFIGRDKARAGVIVVGLFVTAMLLVRR